MNNLLGKYQSYLEAPRGTRGSTSAQGLSLTGDPTERRVGTAKPKGETLLDPKNLSSSTIRNYLSDTRHFLKWLSKAIQEPEILPRHITPAVVKAYQLDLSSKTSAKLRVPNHQRSAAAAKDGSELKNVVGQPPKIPTSTINRRLSALRRFGQFLLVTGLRDDDPTIEIQNLNPTTKSISIGRIIKQYRNHLKDEELSNSTIKNYLSDLRSYLLWAQQNNLFLDKQLRNRQT